MKFLGESAAEAWAKQVESEWRLRRKPQLKRH